MKKAKTGNCKDCCFWGEDADFECSYAQWENAIPANNKAFFILQIGARDDQGLHGCVLTGPEFGCVKFEPHQSMWKCKDEDCGWCGEWDEVQIFRDGDPYDPRTTMYPVCPNCLGPVEEEE